MRTLWRVLFYLWTLAAIAGAGIAGVAQGKVGEAIFVVSFFWLGMPWTAVLANVRWSDGWTMFALVFAVVLNLGLLRWLGWRRQRATTATNNEV